MKLPRFYSDLDPFLKPNKVLVIYGPRQVGQTTLLEDFLIFGGYPEVVATEEKKEKTRLLTEISSTSLLKDILALDRVKSSSVLLDLLRLLAFQVGSEVSLSDLGGKLGLDYKTVGRYIDLFEKSFVIFTLGGFSRNLRNEMTKKAKYYFFDTGIRNALIVNFNRPALRNYIGQLWENFLFISFCFLGPRGFFQE